METASAAIEVIKKYPHLSACKGQGYMVYHKLGYIPQHVYKNLKKTVRRLIFRRYQIANSYPREHPTSMSGRQNQERYGQRILPR